MRLATVAILLGCFIASRSTAQVVLFDDNFEGNLSAWSTPGYGVIVPDPLDAGNKVLSFSHTANSGNMWSSPLSVSAGTIYVFSFRYLGNADGSDSGGYLWLVDPAYGNVATCPVWGTHPANANVELIDDGQWHSYQLTFAVTDFFAPMSGQLQVTVEDWDGAAGVSPPANVAGDAFFDDIQIYELGAVPSDVSTWGELKASFR